MSNGAAAGYTLTGVQQTLGELALSQQELDQLGTLLDIFKARRQLVDRIIPIRLFRSIRLQRYVSTLKKA